ncbi:hypothetical protein ACWD3J_14000 [Streptomyces sp. NPDC002755]
MEITHQTVRDYIAAKQRGDTGTTERIIDEAKARFATRTTDGTEIAQLLHASMHVRLGEGL